MLPFLCPYCVSGRPSAGAFQILRPPITFLRRSPSLSLTGKETHQRGGGVCLKLGSWWTVEVGFEPGFLWVWGIQPAPNLALWLADSFLLAFCLAGVSGSPGGRGMSG